MKKIFSIIILSFLISCQQNRELKLLKVIKFDIEEEVYQQGFSNTQDPFLFNLTENDIAYKYFINTSIVDSIDLKKELKKDRLGSKYLLFNDHEYVVYLPEYFELYNSKTKKNYKLDSLTNYNGMEYLLNYNNLNSFKNDKILLTNWFTCDLYNKPTSDIKETIIACEQLNKKKPVYSILDFKNNTLKSSIITFKDIKPETKNNTSEIWFKTTSLFVDDKILYNNNFLDGVFEIDKKGLHKKVFSIKSKYAKFEKVALSIKNVEELPELMTKVINYSTQVNGILYDEYRNKILVIVVHGTKDIEKNGDKKLSNRPFSILVYNKDYELENEYLFDSLKHDFNNIYVCKEGLIINANNSLGNNYKPQKLIYEIFTY